MGQKTSLVGLVESFDQSVAYDKGMTHVMRVSEEQHSGSPREFEPRSLVS